MSNRIEVGCDSGSSYSNYSYRQVVSAPIETNMGRVPVGDGSYRCPDYLYKSEPATDHAFEAWLGIRPLYDWIMQPSSSAPMKAVTVRYEREPDRDVDNDVSQRCREAAGDYGRDSHRDHERDYFEKRPWSETAKDAAIVSEKLWEASQMAKAGSGGMIAGGIKCLEAAEPAARVIEDVGKESVERFVDSRTDAVKGGYSQYSDVGFM